MLVCEGGKRGCLWLSLSPKPGTETWHPQENPAHSQALGSLKPCLEHSFCVLTPVDSCSNAPYVSLSYNTHRNSSPLQDKDTCSLEILALGLMALTPSQPSPGPEFPTSSCYSLLTSKYSSTGARGMVLWIPGVSYSSLLVGFTLSQKLSSVGLFTFLYGVFKTTALIFIPDIFSLYGNHLVGPYNLFQIHDTCHIVFTGHTPQYDGNMAFPSYFLPKHPS